MNTTKAITILEITDCGREDTLAAIEELTTTGKLTSTDGDTLTITDGYGWTLTAEGAIAELRDYLPTPLQVASVVPAGGTPRRRTSASPLGTVRPSRSSSAAERRTHNPGVEGSSSSSAIHGEA